MSRPNIFFLPVDDLRPQRDCYGETQMKPPHSDELASPGARYDHDRDAVANGNGVERPEHAGFPHRLCARLAFVDEFFAGCRMAGGPHAAAEPSAVLIPNTKPMNPKEEP
jgi:hypothetical protein